MLNQQPLGQHADGGHADVRQAFDRQQGLMLLRLDAGGADEAFAEIQKAADLVAKSASAW